MDMCAQFKNANESIFVVYVYMVSEMTTWYWITIMGLHPGRGQFSLSQQSLVLCLEVESYETFPLLC